jgi:hypothetical protein
MIQRFPRPVNPKVRVQTDDKVAKLSDLNRLVRDVNQLNLNQSTPTGIPFQDYPPAGLTTAGPKFTYTDGVELISYHIKGIRSFNYSNSSGFSEYLCTVSIDPLFTGLFPGSISGMFLSGTNNDIVTSPLAVGGLIEINGNHVPLTSFNVTFYNYNNNPQPDGKLWYAVIIQGYTDGAPGYLTGLASYDIELLLPNFVSAPTIFQD